jgi:putative FmdB family regulatory protein
VPIYDYTCSKCRRVTEVIHGINDHGPKFCPECGAQGTMTKAFVAPTIHFKGTGWAKKDRGTAARSQRSKDEKSTSGNEGAGSGSGSETTKSDATKSDATKSDNSKSDNSKSDAGSSGSSSSSSGPSD